MARAELSADFQAALKPLPPHRQAALGRAGRAGADQTLLAGAARQLAAGQTSSAITVWDGGGRLEALVLTEGAGPSFPLISLYDRQTQREVFGRRTLGWELKIRRNGTEIRLTETDFPARAQLRADGTVLLSWECGDALRVEMPLKLAGNRLEAGFKVDNADPGTVLEEALFPRLSLRKLENGVDKLVIPFMSGVELANPTATASEIAQQDYWYPSSDLNMQFGAYYDARGGVYFAHEDPTGAVKRIATIAKRGDLDAAYTTSVGRPLDGRGGNDYELSGVAAIEVFDGNWYDAAQIYKRFVQARAAWRIARLPRQDTPQVLRDNTVWIETRTRHGYTAAKMVHDLAPVRKYLELPFIVHWSDWYDVEQGGWPHFFASAETLAAIPELHKLDIQCDVYIDSRLWSEKDGPGRRANWMFNPLGEHYAVRTADGAMPAENYTHWFYEPGKRGWYSERHRYMVMCPAARGWREWMLWLSERVADYGVDGIYHDQVMAAAPHLCFSTEHGHMPGDAQAWVRDGYTPMLQNIRAKISPQHPRLFHQTEDFAEAYLHLFDMSLCWRWTHEQIPLVSAVYAGSIQLGNRLYGDGGAKGDVNALYAKVGEQLVRGEQLGFFTRDDIANPAAMLFIKKCAHLRYALRDVFNAGTMLKNIEYASAMPVVSTVWNAYKGGSGGGDRAIRTPAVQQGRWRRLNDGGEFTIFVNTTAQEQRFTPRAVPPRTVLVNLDGVTPYPAGAQLTLPPFGMALLLENVPAGEANALHQTLVRLNGFLPPGAAADTAQAQTRAQRPFTARDAAQLGQACPADDGSFAGWMQPGATLKFNAVLPGKTAVVTLKAASPEAVVRVLFNDREIGRARLLESGRRQVSIPLTGNFSAPGVLTLHFPSGVTEFYSLDLKK